MVRFTATTTAAPNAATTFDPWDVPSTTYQPPPKQYEYEFGKKFENAFDNDITNGWLSAVIEHSQGFYSFEYGNVKMLLILY